MSFAAVIERLRTLSNPYPGLRPFETAESHLFFGRDQQVAELVARLERNRFLAVVGLSGSGKSSLVRAGLIPALERGRVLEAGRRWRIVVTRPGAAPFQSLSADLSRAGLDPAPLTRSSHGLIEVAQQLSPDESLLVVVDQFEELFRYKDLSIASADLRERRGGSAADAAEFVQLLLEASRQPRPVYVVITMRSDYLGDCAEFRDLPETLNDCQYLVPRMTREQRKEAIEVPLGQVAIAPSLVQRLLNDAGDEPDQLPVLQHALMRTWHRWRRDDPDRARRIEPADYAAIGGFEQAIDQHAEEVLAGVDAAIAERIFKRLTARGRGNRERRDPATFDDLCAICGADTADARTRVAAVVDAFRRGDATFLTPRDGALSGATYVDITHESLIRHWRRLRDTWLPGEQLSAKTFLTLAERARSWEAGRAEPLSGLDLRDAQQWDRQRNPAVAWARHYGDANDLDLVLRFIGASKIHDRNLRLRKRGLLVAVPLAVVFGALAVFAVTQASRARELGRVSLSRQLVARSQLLLAESANLRMSVLLAVEALRRAPGADAEQALRRSMARLPREIMRTPLTASSDARIATAIAPSDDGRTVAVVTNQTRIAVIDVASGRERSAMTASSAVLSLVPGSAGTWLAATADDAGVVHIVSVPAGQEVGRYATGSGVALLALSRDQRHVLSVGSTVRVDDLTTGASVALGSVQKPPSAAAISANGQRATIGLDRSNSETTRDYVARVFDATTGRIESEFALEAKVVALTFSADGRFLVTADADTAVHVFDLERRTEPARISLATSLAAVAVSDDARLIVTAGADGTARVFETATRVEIARLSHECPPAGQAGLAGQAGQASPASRQAGQDQARPEGPASNVAPPPCAAHAVAMSRDGRVAFSSGDDGILHAFDAAGAFDVARNTDVAFQGPVFAKDGQRFVVVGQGFDDWRVRVFDAPDWKETIQLHSVDPDIRTAGVSDDGRFVAVVSKFAGGPTIYEVDRSGGAPAKMNGQVSLESVALSADGARIVSVGQYQGLAGERSANELRPLRSQDVIHALAVSADGRLAFAATGALGDGSLIVLRLPDGTEEARIGGFTIPLMFVTVSADARWAVVSALEQELAGGVHMIDLQARKRTWDHPGALRTVAAFSADSRSVAILGADGSLHVLEASTGKEISRMIPGRQPVALSFADQGRDLMTASSTPNIAGTADIVVSRYPIGSDDLTAAACARVTRNFSEAEWTRHVGAEVPYEKTCAAK